MNPFDCKYRTVTKRSGTEDDFNYLKIVDAIVAAMRETYEKPSRKKAKEICKKVIEHLNSCDKDKISVEDIQDFVELSLNEFSEFATAKKYIIYRHERAKDRRNASTLLDAKHLIGDYISASDWRVNENSNAGYSFPSMVNHISSSVIAAYTLNSVYTDNIAQAHVNGDFHIHDLGLGIIPYCSGWSLKDLLLKGFVGCHGRASASPAKHFDTALLQAVNFLSTLQTEFSGAQALNDFDLLLAPYVRKDNLTYKQVKQVIQQMVFGLNVGSRLGQCIPEEDEILSVNKGWVSCDDVAVGDEIYVFDMKTKKLKTDIVKHITKRMENGNLHKYSNNKGFEQLVTSEHRVIYKTGSNNLKIANSKHILDNYSKVDIPVSAEVVDKDYPIDDALLEFLVFILCDGCICIKENREPCISFYKSKKRWGSERFSELCNYLKIPFVSEERFRDNFSKLLNIPENKDYSCTEYRLHSCDMVREILKYLNCTKKKLPKFFKNLSARQSRLVINTWAKLDGTVCKNHLRLQCDSEEIQDCLQEVAVRAGYGTRKYEKAVSEDRAKTRYISVYNKKFKTCSIEEVPYNGRVWCVTTDTGTIVVRHKGRTFITGNCPFTNISFDLSIPEDMAGEPVIYAGDYLMDETYADYQKEMDMINLAFMEVMYEGDASGAIFSFPIPTYNLTDSFNWDSPVANMLFKMTAKYGIPYFQNFISSDLDPRSVRSMCCRLRLDLNEIQDRTGGLFGAGSNTGSIGVCTMNLPRIGYLAKTEDEYFSRLSSLMELAKDSLETKRDYIQQNYNRGLLPYTEKYLKTFDTYFSTIGLVGMNESLRNFMGKDLTTEEGIKFALKVMYFMRDKVVEFQKETGHLFNLEATPGEGCSYRLAKIDKKRYADIITAGTEDSPYYTNSIQLPVNFTDDVFTALDLQEELQRTFTGGTVFHTFIGEELTPAQTKKLVKAIASNYSIPYFSITPTFSICPEHGYIAGYHETCPHCK